MPVCAHLRCLACTRLECHCVCSLLRSVFLRMAFDATCPDCNIPGDDCPPVWGQCGHAFHMHCVGKWQRRSTTMFRLGSYEPPCEPPTHLAVDLECVEMSSWKALRPYFPTLLFKRYSPIKRPDACSPPAFFPYTHLFPTFQSSGSIRKTSANTAPCVAETGSSVHSKR